MVQVTDDRVYLEFGSGPGNMVTEVTVEIVDAVSHINVIAEEFTISGRGRADNDNHDPIVKFDTLKSDTGTLVRYMVGSKYHPEDSARFKVSVLIPSLHNGTLDIDGATLGIKTWHLGKANFCHLQLSTDVGNITIHNGTHFDTDEKQYPRDRPTMRTTALNASVRQYESIHLNAPMVAAVDYRGLHARLETREGDITFAALTNMFTNNYFGPLTAISSTGNATIEPSTNSKYTIRYLQPPQRGLERVFKSENREEEPGMGSVSVRTIHNEAGLFFENYQYQ
ncbi:hypothetical protein BGW39_001343 [Mortierella sp. 14UC]|nr:hypothetical protein BGW39_001343 [Mortierella sp. 14UC]